MFHGVSPAPADAILGLTEAWRRDPNPDKINLGVGVFKDENGATPVLASVKEAERRILDRATSKSYMPIAGSPGYREHMQRMLVGAGHVVLKENRIRTAHTPGGTGGLRVGADMLTVLNPSATIWMSNPTWANHQGIFAAAGFKTSSYPYYDPATKGLDVQGMMACLAAVPAGDVVLLHVCCHNPTGVDLNQEQWKDVAAMASEKGWIPFLDFAYQGFGENVEADRAGLLAVIEACPEVLVSSSCSKNFGLYQDRTGAFSLIGSNAGEADAAFSHAEIVIRTNYSNPPAHGGEIVDAILSDEALSAQWLAELAGMRERIAGMRNELVQGLAGKGVDRDFSFIKDQKGMFSFSGLEEGQVATLRDRYSIYIVKSGRINVAGITPGNLDYLCSAIADVLG